MKVFSTFTGIGGFELGIDHAAQIMGASIEHVGYSEIDKFAISVFEKHYEGVKNYGDITKIEAESLPDFDCLVGGFPCQAFSIAGKRGGFSDTRGTLFFDLARILRTKQPRLFVFENVKGLLNHDSGRTFRTIITTITELGYDCQWQVLNSKDFGVPQNRERIIIIGHLRGTPRPQVFPFIGTDTKDTRIIGQDVAYTIDANYSKGTNTLAKSRRSLVDVGTLRTHKDGNGFREMKSGLAPTIPARARNDGSGQPVIRVREATAKGYAEATVGDAINLQAINSTTRRGRVGKGIANTIDTTQQQYTIQPVQNPDRMNKKQNGRRIKDDGDPSHTLTATDKHGVMISKTVRAGGRNSPHGAKQNWDSYEVDGIIRRLTPMECERLQAFPDNWTLTGVTGCNKEYCEKCSIVAEIGNGDIHMMEVQISDTQRYKMCGNAVTTNVIQAVFERILA